ncbi:hypothetical protein SNEBB_007825 [Seison nebaliae]|nr:hypothetical protein SNEBB_007825 [Seison nebaliae]
MIEENPTDLTDDNKSIEQKMIESDLENSSPKTTNFTINRQKLIVNYLPQAVNDKYLMSIFGPFGRVKSARVIRNIKKNYSYGYGFVEFHNEEAAKAARFQLDGTTHFGKLLKVDYSRPCCEQTKNTNVYIKNLPLVWTENDLRGVCLQFGEIIQLKLLKNSEQLSKGIAFVIFATKNEARNCITNIGSETPVDSLQIEAKFADDHSKLKLRERNHLRNDTNNIVVNSEHDKCGEKGMMNKENIKTNEINDNGYKDSNELKKEGKDEVEEKRQRRRSIPPPPLPPSHVPQRRGKLAVLYVYGIGPNAKDNCIWILFAVYGVVMRVDVIRNRRNGLGKGYAFVTMSTYEGAYQAAQALNGSFFEQRKLQVSIRSVSEQMDMKNSFTSMPITNHAIPIL